MRHPDPLLFGAYFRASGEDRVTEVLATVLAGAPVFAGKFAELAGLPPAATYDIRTQVGTPGNVVDLEIRAKDAQGKPAWILWSEHKKNSPFAPRQLTRY